MKKYLGDGVYVDVESGMIKLTTDNGDYVTNTIYLEVPVYNNLVKYFNEVSNMAAETQHNE